MSICPGVLATHSGASPAASAQDAKVCRASYMRRYRRPLFFITLAHTSLSLSWRIGLEHLQKLKERLARVDGKEREIVRAELAGEEEKIKIEKDIFDFEKKLGQYLTSFNQYLTSAVDHLRSSPYPYDAKPYLEKARFVLKDIMEMLKETKSLEEKLISLTTVEKKFLKEEQETA